MSTSRDERWMRQALDEASRAPEHGDVPVGCVIVRGDSAIASSRNERELRQDPTAHAEVLAIRDAAIALGGWRLSECVLYVTLEPCAMCVGAMIQARIARVVFGAYDEKAGAAGTVVDLTDVREFNHRIEVNETTHRERVRA